MAAVSANKAPNWVTFMGVLFLLIGIFFSARTLFNLFAFPQYPTSASTGLGGLSGINANVYNEEACQGDEACIKSFKEVRNQAMLTDATNSLFFLFLGGGILYTRKRFYK